MQPLRGSQETQKHNPILRNIMIQQHSNRHQPGSARTHNRIHEENKRVGFPDSGGQFAVVQLGLAIVGVGLDEDFANDGIADDTAEAVLHGASCTEDRDAGDVGLESQAVNCLFCGRLYFLGLVWQLIQGTNFTFKYSKMCQLCLVLEFLCAVAAYVFLMCLPLNDQSGKTIGVKNKIVSRGLNVANNGVQTLHKQIQK